MIDFGYEKEAQERERWAAVKYTDKPCPNCQRQRVELCENGKHWCEKCNWVIEDEKYFCPAWRA